MEMEKENLFQPGSPVYRCLGSTWVGTYVRKVSRFKNNFSLEGQVDG